MFMVLSSCCSSIARVHAMHKYTNKVTYRVLHNTTFKKYSTYFITKYTLLYTISTTKFGGVITHNTGSYNQDIKVSQQRKQKLKSSNKCQQSVKMTAYTGVPYSFIHSS